MADENPREVARDLHKQQFTEGVQGHKPDCKCSFCHHGPKHWAGDDEADDDMHHPETLKHLGPGKRMFIMPDEINMRHGDDPDNEEKHQEAYKKFADYLKKTGETKGHSKGGPPTDPNTDPQGYHNMTHSGVNYAFEWDPSSGGESLAFNKKDFKKIQDIHQKAKAAGHL